MRTKILTTPFDPRYPLPEPMDRRLTAAEFFCSCDCPPAFDEQRRRWESQPDDGGAPLANALEREALLKELTEKEEALAAFSAWAAKGSGMRLVTGERGSGKSVFLNRCVQRNLGGAHWELLRPDPEANTVLFLEHVLRIQRPDLLPQGLKADVVQRLCRRFLPAGNQLTRLYPEKTTDLVEEFLGYAKKVTPRKQLHPDLLALFADLEAACQLRPKKRALKRIEAVWAARMQPFCAIGETVPDEGLCCLAQFYLLVCKWDRPRRRVIFALDCFHPPLDGLVLYDAERRDLLFGLAALDRVLQPFSCSLAAAVDREAILSLPPSMEEVCKTALDVTGFSSLQPILPKKIRYLKRNSIMLEEAYRCGALFEDSGRSGDRINDLAPWLDRLFGFDCRQEYDFLCKLFSRKENAAFLRKAAQRRRNPCFSEWQSCFLFRSVVRHLCAAGLLRSSAFSEGNDSEPVPPEEAVRGLTTLLTVLCSEGKMPFETLLLRAKQCWPSGSASTVLRLLYAFSDDRGDAASLRLFRLTADYPALGSLSCTSAAELEELLSEALPQDALYVSAGPSGRAFLEQLLPDPGFAAALCGFREPAVLLVPNRLPFEPQARLPLVLYLRSVRSAEKRLLAMAQALSSLDGGFLANRIEQTHTAAADLLCGLLLRSYTDRPTAEACAALSETVNELCQAAERPDRAPALLAAAFADCDWLVPPAE